MASLLEKMRKRKVWRHKEKRGSQVSTVDGLPSRTQPDERTTNAVEVKNTLLTLPAEIRLHIYEWYVAIGGLQPVVQATPRKLCPMHDWTCYTSRAEFYIVEDANEDYARISGLNKTCRVIYNEFMPWLARNTYTSVRILSCKCQDASCRIDKTVPSIFRNAIQTIKVEFRINGDTNGSIDPGSMVSASFPSLERLYMTSKVAELQPILRSVDKRWCVKSLKDKSVLTELARNGLDDLKSIQDDYPPKDERNYRLDIAVPWGWYRAGSSAVAEDFEGFTLRTRHIEIEDGSVEFQYQIGDAMQEYDAVIERTGYESWLVWHDEYRMRGHFNSGTHPRGSAVYYNATPWVREQFSDK